jgi:hypothetical protein
MKNRGIAVIGQSLKDEGFEVSYLDFNKMIFIPPENSLDFSSRKGLYGISVNYKQFNTTKNLINRIKNDNQDSLVVLGGILPSTFPKEVLERSDADVAVIGRGDFSIKQIADYYINNDAQLSDILGIAYKQGKEILFTGKRRQNEQIIQPDPDYYEPRHIIVSRGCTGKCVFCSNNSESDYLPKQGLVLADSGVLMDRIKMGVKEKWDTFYLEDVSVGVHKKFFDSLYDNIRKGSIPGDVGFVLPIRVDDFLRRRKVLENLLEEGVSFNFEVGYEAGSDALLNLIGKMVNFEQNLMVEGIIRNWALKYNSSSATRVCRSADFITFSHPNMCYEDCVDNFKFLHDLFKNNEEMQWFNFDEVLFDWYEQFGKVTNRLHLQPFTPITKSIVSDFSELIGGEDVFNYVSDGKSVACDFRDADANMVCMFTNNFWKDCDGFFNRLANIRNNFQKIIVRLPIDNYCHEKKVCFRDYPSLNFEENTPKIHDLLSNIDFSDYDSTTGFLTLVYDRLRPSRLLANFMNANFKLDYEGAVSLEEFYIIYNALRAFDDLQCQFMEKQGLECE